MVLVTVDNTWYQNQITASWDYNHGNINLAKAAPGFPLGLLSSPFQTTGIKSATAFHDSGFQLCGFIVTCNILSCIKNLQRITLASPKSLPLPKVKPSHLVCPVCRN